ncbi:MULTISPECIES: hypothetical protein [Pantoea]|uniref:hypothetical protein n=1 Tax=Pantoea TaxID=53335 RepID=UPI0025926DC3|nr:MULTISPECIES: hypothetical protein [Pantoea]
MKFKLRSALLIAAIAGLSGCDKNDIDCDTSSLQDSLSKRLLTVFAEKAGSNESLNDLLKHVKVTLADYHKDEEHSTENMAQCSVKVTFTDARASSTAIVGTANYQLLKNGDRDPSINDASIWDGIDRKNFKPVKIDETVEQKEWREQQEKIAADKARAEEAIKAKEAAKQAELLKEINSAKQSSNDAFKAVNSDQLMLLFLANSGRQVSDEEKLSLLSGRWNAERDPFKKNDMKQSELESAENQLAAFKGIKLIKISRLNYRMNGKKATAEKSIVTSAFMNMRKPDDYDFDTKSFPMNMSGCNDSLKYGPELLYNTRQNVKVNLIKNAAACSYSPANEDEARRISGILSDIPTAAFSADSTAYLLITDYDADKVDINTVLIRSDVDIFSRSVDVLNDKAPVLTWTLQ